MKSNLHINTTDPAKTILEFPLLEGQKYNQQWNDIDESVIVQFSGFENGEDYQLIPEQLVYMENDEVIWYYLLNAR